MKTASIQKKPPAAASAERPRRAPRTPEEPGDSGAMRMVTLRMPTELIEGLKRLAKSKRRPYQAMARAFLADRLKAEQAEQANHS